MLADFHPAIRLMKRGDARVLRDLAHRVSRDGGPAGGRRSMKHIALAVTLVVCTAGCSVRRFAVNKVGDAIAGGGSTYEQDDDVELIGSALPFSLKLVESLLAESPRHRGLLQSACQGFATYGYLYVQQPADTLAATDIDAAAPMRARARRLYLRASNYGCRALEIAAPGFSSQVASNPRAAVAQFKRKQDVPLIYWNAVALGLAIGVSKNDAAMLARIPEVDAMLARALELDESWDNGSLHEFGGIFAGAKPGRIDYDAMKKHYERAVELSAGARGGIHVAFAEAYCVPKQDTGCFNTALKKALAIDAYAKPSGRLQNVLAVRRANSLMERRDELILPAEGGK
jgi:predicted anti-sigma-YlaC factor YlaD